MFANAGLVLLLTGTAASVRGAEAPVPPGAAAAVVAAIEAAVRARVGEGVTLSVSDVTGLRMAGAAAGIVATPDPTARVGAPTRFVLADGRHQGMRARLGEVTATVRVVADVVRTRRRILQGDRLAEGDVQVEASDLTGQPWRRLPPLDEAIGARARHDLGMNAVVRHADIAVEPLVRAGEVVRARARVGEVEIVGQLVAAQNGAKNDVVRVVNAETRHARRARVTGSGEVEVVDVR